MNTTIASRLASISLASLMTLAMLLSINTLAVHDAPHAEMATTASASAQG